MVMKEEIWIRAFEEADFPQVKDIFLRANKSLVGPISLSQRFDDYLQAAIGNELCRIVEFYGERQGGFWVAVAGSRMVGMIGLAPMLQSNAMELRRMCVDPDFHRQGIGREILRFAFAESRRRGFHEIELSTTEFHSGALALYAQAGFRLVREQLIESVDRVVRTVYLSRSLDPNSQECLMKPFTDQMMRAFRQK
jgi:GNAT superfamily N-acetyltransferase